MANKFEAVTEVGTFARTSKTRTYTHVVVANDAWTPEMGFGALGWAGSLELARKSAKSYSNQVYHWSNPRNAEEVRLNGQRIYPDIRVYAVTGERVL